MRFYSYLIVCGQVVMEVVLFLAAVPWLHSIVGPVFRLSFVREQGCRMRPFTSLYRTAQTYVASNACIDVLHPTCKRISMRRHKVRHEQQSVVILNLDQLIDVFGNWNSI